MNVILKVLLSTAAYGAIIAAALFLFSKEVTARSIIVAIAIAFVYSAVVVWAKMRAQRQLNQEQEEAAESGESSI